MTVIIRAAALLLLLMHLGCNDSGGDRSDGGGDARVVVDDGGQPCVDTSECPNLFVCAYKIADDCSAVGHCAPAATPTCASIIELCGCGKQVPGGSCYYQTGYAGGPTTGATECFDGGI